MGGRSAPKMMYPLVRELAADQIPVVVTCRVLGFSKQAFYKWQANPGSRRDWDDAHLINAAADIHHDDPKFGYRYIADDLAAVAATLNNRPREVLGWKTPAEVFDEHLLSLQQGDVATID